MFLAAGAPTIAVWSASSSTSAGQTGWSPRIGQVETRLEARIEQVDSRIGQVDSRIGQVESRLGSRIDRIADDLKVFYRDLGRHDADITNLKQR